MNPVSYIDITPGHDWLMGPINELIDRALQLGELDGDPIGRIARYIEQMGTRRDSDGRVIYREEFWWEREWRRVHEFPAFQKAVEDPPLFGTAPFIDPHWGLEQIISRLSG